jgi:hydrogenase/urease accessory protein HupE
VKRRVAQFLVLSATLFAPAAAHAHLVNSGLGPIYDGALHLILTPMDIVRLVALGLFAGAQEPRGGRAIVVAAPVSWFLAGAAALSLGAAGTFAVADGAGLFLLGAAIALDLRPPTIVAAAAAAAFAGLLGFQSGIELRAGGGDWTQLLGTTAVVLVLLLLVTSLVTAATAFVARIACRVLGSWAAATGLLSIGWIVAANR